MHLSLWITLIREVWAVVMDASRKHFKESPLGRLRSISKSTCWEREGPGGAAQTLSWRGGAERPGRLKRPSSEGRVPERGVRWGDRTRDKGPMCRHRLTTDQHTHQKKRHETSQRTTLGWSGDASGEEPARQCRRHRNTGRSRNPWVGKIPWRRAWQPPWYSCLENPMDREAWRATVNRGAESRTRLKQLCTSHTNSRAHSARLDTLTISRQWAGYLERSCLSSNK